ncbi:MAG: O-sialoglycoprotein endopeptidase [Clostridiales bacterium]
MKTVFLGLDTSCYTTSLALTDGEGRLLYQQRRLLSVKAGEKGLRQSEAFYQHMLHLPELFKEMEAALPFALTDRLAAIAVSTKPCRRQESYMPVFRAGQAVAQALAAAAAVPLISTTHQEGHLMAALWSADLRPFFDSSGTEAFCLAKGKTMDWQQLCPFLAFHLSGGTTELILVRQVVQDQFFCFDYSVVSGTLDIPAGQLIDRTGQVLGLPFPAGPHLENLALSKGPAAKPLESIPTHCRQGFISLSGGEAWAKRSLAGGKEPAEIARTIEHYIAGSLVKAVDAYLDRKPEELPKFIIFMGGVASNAYIRQLLQARLERKIPCVFALPEYSTDNALGTALIGAASVNKGSMSLNC